MHSLLKLALKLLFALCGLYFVLSGVILLIAAAQQHAPDARTALRIASVCFLAASLPALTAVVSIRKAKRVGAVLAIPASLGLLCLVFIPALQPEEHRAIPLPVVQVAAIGLAVVLVARIADAVRSRRARATLENRSS